MINKEIKDWIFNRQVDINVTVFDKIRSDVINKWSTDRDCTFEEFVKTKAYNVIYDTIADSEETVDKYIKTYIFKELLWDYISANNREHSPMIVIYCDIIKEEFMKWMSTLKDEIYQNFVTDIIKKHYTNSLKIEMGSEMGSELDELLLIFIKCVGKTHTCREIDHDIKAILNSQIVELSFKVPKNLSDEELVKHLTLLVKNKCFLTVG